MKYVKRLVSFIVVLIVLMGAFSTVSFAAGEQYTENLIPAMTSNTNPSGKASASSIWSNSNEYLPWKAFDHSSTYSWASATKTGWLEYDFPDAKCISKYTLTSRNPVFSVNELPRDWTFEGWDEKLSSWIVLDTQKNIIDWKSGIKKEFTFENQNYYSKYRINVTANGGWVDVVIGEMEMMELAAPKKQVPTNLIAKADDSEITLSWDSVKDSTSYNIKRSDTLSGPYQTIATTSAITYKDNNVTNGATYYYVVSALDATGESANSNEISATPNKNASEDSTVKLSVLLNEGENIQLSTSYNLDNNKNFTWSSTNEAVAKVDENGKVNAIAEGTADIYAQNADGTFKEYIPVKVVKGVADELRLAAHLEIGEKAKLYLTDDASKVTWTSMDSSIATVAADGQVTGVKKGLAIVKAEMNGQSYQIYVRVNG
ncbi:Ig-like domain-containing protein [Aminipila terrae]|uniref:BIG2 domain-containing protein n=1 Tax=Aminipila terrae TaxID=2697030 RepID=A0A6P1MLY7_9FIRM|nr:Ig-like domain-containing protein [Aminipila terrae]QHI72005.1 hypothetical protein Ami3637_05975 [Aminipila terrae]